MKLAALLVFALQAPQEAPEAPFAFELPEAYQAFERRDATSDTWVAVRKDGKAQFLVEHWLLEHAGAFPDAVAQYRRESLWVPQLQGLKPKIKAWKGKWARQAAAGNRVEYEIETESRVLLERLVVLGDHMIIGTWEGPSGEAVAAGAALQSFRIPKVWMAGKSIAHDRKRGAEAAYTTLAAPGSLAVMIDVGDGSREYMEVTVELAPDNDDSRGLVWDVPLDDKVVLSPDQPRAKRRPDRSVTVKPDANGHYSVRYRIELDRENNELEHLGIYFHAGAAAFLDPSWIALPRTPELPGDREGRYLPPAWQMRVRIPATMSAISGAAAAKEWLEEDTSTRVLKFEPVASGQGWPFTLIGMYRQEFVADRTLLLRQGSRSSAPDAAVRWLDSLADAFTSWLPGFQADWRIATFPGAGDRTLPGLVLLDENEDWLRDSLDAEWNGLNRRIGLARRIAARPFGTQWRGEGSAQGFLESSLAEYSAWRLLQATAHVEDADRLLASWKQREAAAGDLPTPLSLLPPSDLFGPQRLVSRGALVWLAIEKKATRKKLDAVLRAQFGETASWSTEGLRAALERQTDSDWLPFFEAHIYGRELPKAD